MAGYRRDRDKEDEESNSCIHDCLCCCCLPQKPSVTITTITIILSLIIAIIINLIFYGFKGLMVFIYIIYIIVIISLIALLIGIYKVNKPFMKQFKVVFFLFIIFQTVLMIYDIILRFKDTIETQYYGGKKIEHVVKSNLSTFLKIIIVILAIINFIILICYYIATCKYIDIVERDAEDIDRRRRLEERRK